MCGRFALTLGDFDTLASALEAGLAEGEEPISTARYNIAPMTAHWILRAGKAGGRELVRARWGLVPRWAKDPSIGARLINARGESLPDKPAFREALARRRVIVPASGFFEWTGPKTDRRPLFVRRTDGRLLLMAGLAETWTDPASGQRLRTFTIVTTRPNATVAAIHDRMPALLPDGQVDAWIGRAGAAPEIEALLGLLGPAPDDALSAHPVSRRVNSASAEGPDLVEPIAEGPEPRDETPLRQGRLF